jgi:hypothetical protein
MPHGRRENLDWGAMSIEEILELAIADEVEARDYYRRAADLAGACTRTMDRMASRRRHRASKSWKRRASFWTPFTWTPSTSTATSAGSSGAGKGMRFPAAPSSCWGTSTPRCSAPSRPSRSKAAEAELIPALKGKGLVYRSPIVRMRQMFDLYVCLRPCKAYPGNPLNFKDAIDLVVFRENTEDLYAGVEFNPVPAELARDSWGSSPSPSRPSRTSVRTSTPSHARSTRGRARSDRPRRVRVRAEARAEEGHGRPQGERRPRDRRALPREAKKGREGVPGDPDGRRQRRRDLHVAAEEPARLRRARRPEPVRRHHLRPLRADGRRPRVRLLGEHREKLAVFEPSHGSAPKYAGQYKVNPIATILAAKMMLDWLGETEKGKEPRSGRGLRDP